MRHLFNGLIMLLVTAIIVLALVAFIGWARLPDLISANLTKKMKVSVDIGDISLSTEDIEIDKIEIDNPKGSILPKAFSSETMTVATPFSNYFKPDVVVESIVIDDVYLGFEFKSILGTEGNWTTIMSNYKESTGGNKNSKNVLIKKLILTNISIELVYETGSDQKVKKLKPISRLEFTNVTSSGGIPTDQIMRSVLGQTLKAVFEKENLQNMLDNILQSPLDDTIKDFIKPFKDLFQN